MVYRDVIIIDWCVGRGTGVGRHMGASVGLQLEERSDSASLIGGAAEWDQKPPHVLVLVPATPAALPVKTLSS